MKGNTAMVAKGNKQNKKSQPKCHNCGKKKHFKKDCWAKRGGAAKEDKPIANNVVDQDFGFMAMEVSFVDTVPDLD
jgi:transposase-like protein